MAEKIYYYSMAGKGHTVKVEIAENFINFNKNKDVTAKSTGNLMERCEMNGLFYFFL